MKKFEFRLEKVLKFRRLVKAEKERELKEAQNKYNQSLTLLRNCESAATNEEFGTGGVQSGLQVLMAGLFATRMHVDINRIREELILLEKLVDEAMERYIEASKEAKALELLKEKKKEEYKLARGKEEDSIIDERTVQRSRFKKLGI